MAKSRLERLARIERVIANQHVPALLEVRDHKGEFVFSAGCCWDQLHRRPVPRPVLAHVVTLKESQYEIGHAIGRYLRGRLADDPDRISLLMAIGNRGGGKTFACALLLVAIALAVPGKWQLVVNITSKQKRDVMGAVLKIIPAARPGHKHSPWIAEDVADFRDPYTRFITGNTVQWLTSKNPDAIRTAQLDIEHVLINEGQSQPVEVFNNAAAGIRNTGGIVSVATNPPQRERGDWIARTYQAIEAQPDEEPKKGEAYIVLASKNAAIDQPTLPKIRWMLLAADRNAALADADGLIKLSGEPGYPGFSPLPFHKGGHIAERNVAWKDITRRLTKEKAGSEYDYIGLTDFQTNPGCCASIAKLFENEAGKRLIWVRRFIGTAGRETDLSQALVSAGYYPGKVDFQGKPTTRSLLIVGDATGARQGGAHQEGDLYSFTAMRAEGWVVIPPDYYWSSGKPRNPLIDESRKQMHALFLAYQILLSPDCEQPTGDFCSLVDGFCNTKVTVGGKFVKKGHWTHGPDGVRYGAWCFLDRPQPEPADDSNDEATFDALRTLRITSEF